MVNELGSNPQSSSYLAEQGVAHFLGVLLELEPVVELPDVLVPFCGGFQSILDVWGLADVHVVGPQRRLADLCDVPTINHNNPYSVRSGLGHSSPLSIARWFFYVFKINKKRRPSSSGSRHELKISAARCS